MAKRKSPAAKNGRGITDEEVRDVEELSAPRVPVIYEIVRRLGEEEMERPATSLWWSGIAAGLSISFSVLAEAILITHLPDAEWRPLIADLGYSVGFLMVILARQQLFTESTITAVLPVLKNLSPTTIWQMGRLWGIVLAANLAGTLFAALFCAFTPVLSPELYEGMIEVSRSLLKLDVPQMFFAGIASGFLIAAMVWMIPSAESAKFIVVTLMTYLIAAGGFTHIVAGSLEAYLLVINGDWAWWEAIVKFALPVLAGNMVGGTCLFAVLSYAQVKDEI
ncbi:formate/nitrite transporter family protein [Pseudolabrys sp. FHR47]|uniref:formate/nitrite transporter family protein n=1 Tax=Pseudolabrys sp. FHR47 TaxID=2562284 RepID=UPI0010BF4C76|nr:formate/nitrite transporter family protein [Pseudolabrys sp. FHR47]